jgi:hypothetical protein
VNAVELVQPVRSYAHETSISVVTCTFRDP